MDNRILLYIWLSTVLRPGSKTPKLLFEHFGSIEKIYAASHEDYKALSVSSDEIACLDNKNLDNAKRCYEYCVRSKVGFLCYEDPSYPERLKIIDNPPVMFYYRGRLICFDDYPCITMVGTRSCSERGFRMAYEEAFKAASKGAVIVNGLALGIDGACIAGALDANGFAIGLLGCGIDRVYPEGNRDLFERLTNCGLILTEFPPFTKPIGANFPVRNRVISALSLATVVFEAAEGSGALITAKHALEQGRRIFAVPGKPYDKTYAGPLELIKDGATVFTEAEDVLSEYSMSFPHRINLANSNKPSNDKLNAYVAKYFKKDIDPDQPVNRRHVPKKDKSKDISYQKSGNISSVDTANGKHSQKKEAAALSFVTAEKSKQPADDSIVQAGTATDLSVLSVTERDIYDTICKHNVLSPDEISDFGFKIEDVLSTLTILEIYGLIKSLPGGKYEIK